MAHRKYMLWAAPWRLSENEKGPKNYATTQTDNPRLLPTDQPIRWLQCGRCIGLGHLPGTMVWVGQDEVAVDTRGISARVAWALAGSQ